MRNLIAFVLAAVMSAAIVFVAALLFFPGEEKGDSASNSENATALTVSQSDSRASLYQFMFLLDDEAYSLPCKYSEFEKNGWVLRNPTELIKGCSNMTLETIARLENALSIDLIKSALTYVHGYGSPVSSRPQYLNDSAGEELDPDIKTSDYVDGYRPRRKSK